MREGTRRSICSYILKCIVIISAAVGIVLSARGRRGSFMGGRTVFMFFTIQSNLLIAILCLIGFRMVGKAKVSRAWYVLQFVGTVAITLTGVVFCVVLAPTLGPAAWKLNNVLTHVIVPVAAILDLFVSGTDGELRRIDVLWVTIPPILYACYAGIGYAMNWNFGGGYNYPYFFLNWGSKAGAIGFTGELPFMGCVWWILVLLFFLLGVGELYISVLKRLKK